MLTDCQLAIRPDSQAARLAMVRQAVGTQGRGGVAAAAALSLGVPALDAACPGGGLALGALHEAGPQAHFDEPAALGFLLAVAARALGKRPGELVWVRRRGAGAFGAPCAAGLAAWGIDPRRLLLVGARTAIDALWAVEEAARTCGLAAVLAEPGAALSLVATRRLQLAAEAGGAPVLVRAGVDAAPVTAARTRWRIAARPGPAPAWAAFLPPGAAPLPPCGAPAWRAHLARAKGGQPKTFDLDWDHETHRFHVAPPLADGSSPPARARAAA